MKKQFVSSVAIVLVLLFLPQLADAACTEGDCRNGAGSYVWDSGNKYEGDFVKGKRTGHGTFTFANGDIYTGDFLDGKFSGHGKYTYADGDVYDGQWQNGKMAGKGVLQRPDGSKQEGSYSDGAIVEKWNMNTEELHEPDANKYPRGHIEKLMADPVDDKKTKKPSKK